MEVDRILPNGHSYIGSGQKGQNITSGGITKII